MGIYDREYYRRESPSFLGSFTERGRMCKYLIFANVACFLLQWATLPREDSPDNETDIAVHSRHAVNPYSKGAFTDTLRLDAEAVLHGQVWRVLTYAFLHQTSAGLPWHIIINMLFLWWFGSDVEDMYGSREFLAIYSARPLRDPFPNAHYLSVLFLTGANLVVRAV
jgi:membrane associated rhomboid family serine protease